MMGMLQLLIHKDVVKKHGGYCNIPIIIFATIRRLDNKLNCRFNQIKSGKRLRLLTVC